LQTNNTNADVVIVGGGVIGCSIAYFLAVHHGIQAIIIERDAVASAASGGAAGELAVVGRRQYSDEFSKFILAGVKMHQDFNEEIVQTSGIDYSLSDIEQVRPAFTLEEAIELKEQMVWQNSSLGAHAEWIQSSDLINNYPWLNHEVLGGVVTVENQLESYTFCMALLHAGEKFGVQLKTADVVGVTSKGGVLTGIKLGDGRIVETNCVVLANGPWASLSAEWFGQTLPMTPLKGQIVHTAVPSNLVLPHYSIFHGSAYVLPKPGGDLLLGTTDEDVGFDNTPTEDAKNLIMDSVLRLAPILLDVEVRHTTACLRPYSVDGLPILGKFSEWDGVYLATGHGHKGITLALITGKAIADHVSNGESEIDLANFAVTRFQNMQQKTV
jgi:glycine oxidase